MLTLDTETPTTNTFVGGVHFNYSTEVYVTTVLRQSLGLKLDFV